MKNFNTEMEGQIDFYNKFLKRINKDLSQEDVLEHNTDGILNGNIIEFKLNINDINSVLFQAIKYLSSMRIKGKSIPENIVLISLNSQIAYIFNSNHYLDDIEKLYIGGASKNNTGFQSKSEPIKLDYSDGINAENLIKKLKEKNYTKINIDENCIIGWATRYYKEKPTAKKSDFIGDEGEVKIVGEIRRPSHFKDYINPYTSNTNVKFKYLMDKLNDDLSKKDLGAFYTPVQYADKAAELVREAIKRVPKGNDYIILDRCAGTGNLEQSLNDEELSHCIVSTYEYYEYKVLMELLGDKVRHIVPPFETADIFDNGTVIGADALSKEYLDNKIIKKYIDNPDCTIIMLENPPYAESTAMTRGTERTNTFKHKYLSQEMSKEIKGVALNDIANVFIWSAFKYYLREDTDSYIVFSPLKYYKQQHLINKKFLNGYAFNRKHFHATHNTIGCILWSNIDIKEESIKLNCFDIDVSNGNLIDEGFIDVRKVYKTIVNLFPPLKGKKIIPNIVGDDNGKELTKDKKISVRILENYPYIGYLVSAGFQIDSPMQDSRLTTLAKYNGHGIFITKEDYLIKLPMLASAKYMENFSDWKIMGSISKTSDGKEKYLADVKSGKLDKWLLKVLLWTSVLHTSKMLSIKGSDGVFYRNELCLDTTNGETIASEKLKDYQFNEDENKIINQWNKILKQAKDTKNYDATMTYGVYQIAEELNTKHKVKLPSGKEKNVYDYPELNGDLKTLKPMLKEYYLKEIASNLFEYELLK